MPGFFAGAVVDVSMVSGGFGVNVASTTVMLNPANSTVLPIWRVVFATEVVVAPPPAAVPPAPVLFVAVTEVVDDFFDPPPHAASATSATATVAAVAARRVVPRMACSVRWSVGHGLAEAAAGHEDFTPWR